MLVGLVTALFGWLATFSFRALLGGSGYGRAVDYGLGITFAGIGVKTGVRGELAERLTWAPWLALLWAASILLLAWIHRSVPLRRKRGL